MIHRGWRQAALLGRAYAQEGATRWGCVPSSLSTTVTNGGGNGLGPTSKLRMTMTSTQRRFLHEDSSSPRLPGDFVSFSVSNAPSVDPLFGMDMTHAPGYQLAAEDEPPLKGDQKVVDFAVRHSRLSAIDISDSSGDGYIWIGNVLYPSGLASGNEANYLRDLYHDEDEDEVIMFGRGEMEDDEDEDDDDDDDDDGNDDNGNNSTEGNSKEDDNKQVSSKNGNKMNQMININYRQPLVVPYEYVAKRRYTGGQARRIRKERELNKINRMKRVPPPRPMRKPKNDIPPELQ